MTNYIISMLFFYPKLILKTSAYYAKLMAELTEKLTDEKEKDDVK